MNCPEWLPGVCAAALIAWGWLAVIAFCYLYNDLSKGSED